MYANTDYSYMLQQALVCMLIALWQVCAPVTAPLGPDTLDVCELAWQVSCQLLSECVVAEWVCRHAVLWRGVARRPWADLCRTAVALASWLFVSLYVGTRWHHWYLYGCAACQ